MASNEFAFPGGAGDNLAINNVIPTGGLARVGGAFNVSTNPDGTPTGSVSGNVSVNLAGFPVITFDNYTVSYNALTNVYTVKGSQLGGLATLTMTYTGTNPSSINVQFDQLNLPLPPPFGTVSVLGNGAATVVVTPNVPCFASGTLIRTSRGEVAVEDLRVGDMVETTSGKLRPIVWLGNTEIHIKMMMHPIAYQPIRIAADAFGPGMPYADLTVSPGHGLCVQAPDEVIMPPVILVNGTTITQLDADFVHYWQVELDTHDIMYANGLPAECYMNVGNRGFFADVVDADKVHTLADYCRPYVAEGPRVDAMREELRLRAEELGWRADEQPALVAAA